MQSDYLHITPHQEGKKRKLILVFAGWGMDKNPFRHLSGGDSDVILFYDYKHFGFGECANSLLNLFHNYTQVSVIAYSLGVWGASRTFEKFISTLRNTIPALEINRLLKKTGRCIAINGTLFPISATWGIPSEIFTKTIENLPEGLDKFKFRMCGNRECYNRYQACSPERGGEEIKEELIAIEKNMTLTNSIKWNHALISESDYIFPTPNQHVFWNDYRSSQPPLKITTIPGGHFPFFAWNSWEEILSL